LSVSKAFPKTELSSCSTKPDKAPAELGTDSAELARDSSEPLVKGGKRRDGGKDKSQIESGGKKTEMRTEKGGRRPYTRCVRLLK